MPITKREGESRDEFVSRCIVKEMDNGYPQDQAAAICYKYADEEFKTATASVSDATWSTEAPINVNFKKSRILFEEDFDELEMAVWKEMGFKILVRSKRKIKKKDKKVWNKLKNAGLTEDNLVYGEVADLDKKYNFEMIFNGDDPLLTMLSLRGKPADYSKYLASKEVKSIEEALEFQKEYYKNSDLRFATLKTVFVYEEIPGIPATKGSSRPFCSRMMSNRREYTVQEIQEINNSHLVKMFSKYPGLEPSVLLYRGGFYRNPDTGDITAWCRHQWTAKVTFA